MKEIDEVTGAYVRKAARKFIAMAARRNDMRREKVALMKNIKKHAAEAEKCDKDMALIDKELQASALYMKKRWPAVRKEMAALRARIKAEGGVRAWVPLESLPSKTDRMRIVGCTNKELDYHGIPRVVVTQVQVKYSGWDEIQHKNEWKVGKVVLEGQRGAYSYLIKWVRVLKDTTPPLLAAERKKLLEEASKHYRARHLANERDNIAEFLRRKRLELSKLLEELKKLLEKKRGPTPSQMAATQEKTILSLLRGGAIESFYATDAHAAFQTATIKAAGRVLGKYTIIVPWWADNVRYIGIASSRWVTDITGRKYTHPHVREHERMVPLTTDSCWDEAARPIGDLLLSGKLGDFTMMMLLFLGTINPAHALMDVKRWPEDPDAKKPVVPPVTLEAAVAHAAIEAMLEEANRPAADAMARAPEIAAALAEQFPGPADIDDEPEEEQEVHF